jgi:hypothetical protein
VWACSGRGAGAWVWGEGVHVAGASEQANASQGPHVFMLLLPFRCCRMWTCRRCRRERRSRSSRRRQTRLGCPPSRNARDDVAQALAPAVPPCVY